MKKLMILGGARYALPVIEAAHDLGCHVITCDYLPDNIAHKYSDEYCNVSIIDKEAVLSKARELHIDGIMSFACDPGVTTAAYVAEKMGLPSVGSYDSVCILQDKSRFRAFLKENGFRVPTAIGYTDRTLVKKDLDLFHWPVIVKPVDSAGSKGVTRVEHPDQLDAAIDFALKYSLSKRFIIEDYLQQVGFSSDTDSFSVEGDLAFVSFNSQRFDPSAENPYTPASYTWPSSISDEHQRELTGEIQRLIRLLNLKTSIYNIETRECIDGNAYIMECSPRGGGNRLAEVIRYATGVDLIASATRAALGEPLPAIQQKPYDGFWAEIILHSTKRGTFDQVWVSDAIQENIVEKDLWIERHTKVGGFLAANEAIGTLVMRFNTNEEMMRVLDNQDEYIRVLLED